MMPLNSSKMRILSFVAVEFYAKERITETLEVVQENGKTNVRTVSVLRTYSFRITDTVITNCDTGNYISFQNRHQISNNTITTNKLGIWLFRTVRTKINQNTFIDNERHAFFNFIIGYQALFLHYNDWNSNYRDD